MNELWVFFVFVFPWGVGYTLSEIETVTNTKLKHTEIYVSEQTCEKGRKLMSDLYQAKKLPYEIIISQCQKIQMD